MVGLKRKRGLDRLQREKGNPNQNKNCRIGERKEWEEKVGNQDNRERERERERALKLKELKTSGHDWSLKECQ